MPCYNPLQAYFAFDPSGVKSVEFSNVAAAHFRAGGDVRDLGDDIFQLPCGKCRGCRLEKSRQWALRIMHEASLYDDNCFVTLTYDDEHLPKDGSLVKKDFQLFMKKLRKKFDSRIRFFTVVSMEKVCLGLIIILVSLMWIFLISNCFLFLMNRSCMCLSL